ncbi:MAG: hypothetical protein RL077_4741 [Verrucomicrobiota bacterium]|jgi:hypothetical protein
MLLFIAIILIYNFHLAFWWYLIVVVFYVAHLALHLDSKSQTKVDRLWFKARLNQFHSQLDVRLGVERRLINKQAIDLTLKIDGLEKSLGAIAKDLGRQRPERQRKVAQRSPDSSGPSDRPRLRLLR